MSPERGDSIGQKRVHRDPPRTAEEDQIAEQMLEETPEGRGPAKEVVRREIPFVWIASTIAVVALGALVIAARPSWGTIIVVGLLALGYVFASPVILASMHRKRDEVEVSQRAHDVIDESEHPRERVRRRAFYWSGKDSG